jgi:hypothetical protein
LTAINCKFNNTGQGAFFANPASGVDLEGELNGYAVSGMFINCEFANNKTAGLNGAVNFADVSFYRCSFYGTTTSYALLIYNIGTRFFDCTIGGSSAIAGTASVEADRTYFRNCNFNSAATWQGISTTWPAEALVATSLANPIFDTCTFNTTGTSVPLNFSLPTTIYRDCTFNQSTFTGISYPKGTFQNSNSITAATGSIDLSGSTVNSPIRLLGAGTYIGLKTAADPLGGLTAYSSNNFVGLGFNTYLTPTTVAALPSASAVGAGSISFVTNANSTTFNSIVAGGGVNNVPVYSDGANWRIG